MSNRRDFTNKNTKFTGSEGIEIPSGGTGTRGGSPALGTLRYNSDTGLAEFYTPTGWAGVDAPPTISSISGTINQDTDSTITITGTGFKNGSVVYILGAGVSGVDRALTTTYVSQTTLTAATNASAVNYVGGASFNVRVNNPSGLTGQLDNAGTIDRDPIWSTSSGTIATWIDRGSQTAIVTATDPDATSVTYSLASGSLPGNSSLNSSTGAITSSDPTDVASPTTYTFSINATSNDQTATRSFNIIVNPAPDGSTSARAATSATAIKSLTGTTTTGYYWIKNANMSTAVQVYCDMSNDYDSGGWMLLAWAYVGSYNLPNLNHNGTTYSYNATSRATSQGLVTPSGSQVTALQLCKLGSTFCFAAGGNPSSGGPNSYDYVYTFAIPSPSTLNFSNHSYDNSSGFATSTVTVSARKGESGTHTRYTFRDQVGATWSDTYPTGYGAVNGSGVRGWNGDGGPFFPSVHPGSSPRNNGAGWNSTPDVTNGHNTYNYRGWYGVGFVNGSGQTSIWVK